RRKSITTLHLADDIVQGLFECRRVLGVLAACQRLSQRNARLAHHAELADKVNDVIRPEPSADAWDRRRPTGARSEVAGRRNIDSNGKLSVVPQDFRGFRRIGGHERTSYDTAVRVSGHVCELCHRTNPCRLRRNYDAQTRKTSSIVVIPALTFASPSWRRD